MNIAHLVRSFSVCAALAAIPLAAQPPERPQIEVGGFGGGSLYLNNTVTSGSATGDVGFKPGFTVGGWIGHNTKGRLGGEIRYQFQKNDMKLASGGTTVNFGHQAHSIEYGVLIHTNSRDSAIRPFVAIGGGIKGYMGTGTERAFQPLSHLAILSHTTQWQPMVSAGAGVKFAIGSRTLLRVEVRDNATPFPKDVILPFPGASIGGWLHNITPMVGISYAFQ